LELRNKEPIYQQPKKYQLPITGLATFSGSNYSLCIDPSNKHSKNSRFHILKVYILCFSFDEVAIESSVEIWGIVAYKVLVDREPLNRVARVDVDSN
jgi:hypothetical protein